MAIQLRQGELVQSEANFHWAAYVRSGIWAALMGLSFLGQLLGPEKSGVVMFWTAVLGFGPITYVWLQNKNKTYVVTNQRLYVEEGILAKTKTDIPFNKINDISFSQGIFQRMFGSGNVAVMTGNDKPTKLSDLDEPEKFREALSSICQNKAA